MYEQYFVFLLRGCVSIFRDNKSKIRPNRLAADLATRTCGFSTEAQKWAKSKFNRLIQVINEKMYE